MKAFQLCAWITKGARNSNLRAGQKNWGPYPRAEIKCFYQFKGCIYQENKLKAQKYWPCFTLLKSEINVFFIQKIWCTESVQRGRSEVFSTQRISMKKLSKREKRFSSRGFQSPAKADQERFQMISEWWIRYNPAKKIVRER